MRKNISFFVILCLALPLLAGCEQLGFDKKRNDDLEEARSFVRQRDFIEAEKSFERYLRRNPEGGARWEVWNQLVDIARDVRHDSRSTKELMEAMLVEYEGDPYRLRAIREQLGGEYERARNYDRAIALYVELASDAGATELQRATGYRGLARIYLRRLEFTLAEEALKACINLGQSSSLYSQCRYELAAAYMVMEKTDESIRELELILQQPPINGEEAIRVLAVFNLADALEQKGDKNRARALFESIKESYPNSRVVDMRLEYLGKK